MKLTLLIGLIFVTLLVVITPGCKNNPTNSLQPLPAPTFSHPSGLYNQIISISIDIDVIGTTIYYSIDGSTPNEQSHVYSVPLIISDTAVIKAFAVKDGYAPSQISTATYNFNSCLPPIANYPSGVYADTLSLRYSCDTEGATVRYKLDGRVPDEHSYDYVQEYPPQVCHSTTVNSKAFKPGKDPSITVETQYQIGSYRVPIVKNYPNLDINGLSIHDDTFGYSFLSDTGIRIINISDPLNVSEIGMVPDSQEGLSYDCVATKSDFLYYTRFLYSKNGRSYIELVVCNISNPIAPTTVNTIPITLTSSSLEFSMTRVFDQKLVLLLGNRVMIYSLADLQSPVLLFDIVRDDRILYVDCQVVGGMLYLIDFYSDSFDIYSISNPGSPQSMGSQQIDDPFQLVVVNGHAYIACLNRYFTIVSVSNPLSPATIKTIDLGAYHLGLFGNNLIMHCNYGDTSGIIVYDITNPVNMAIKASFYYHPYTWGYSDIVVKGSYAFIPLGTELAIAYVGYLF